MKKLSICLSLLAMMSSYAGPLYAFQGAGGEKKGKSPTATPKPSAPSTPKPPANPPRPATPTADLSVRTNLAGCTVLLNGQPRGNTNQDGFLNLSELKPGNYTVTVRKAGYADGQQTITLGGGLNQQVSFALRAGAVAVSINTNVTGARIEIANVGSYTDRASVQLQPGSYNVTVSKQGFGTTTREVEVAVGKPVSLTIPLSRITPEQMLAQAEQDFGNRRYPTVIATCRDLVQNQPDSPRVNYLLGQSYYNAEQYADGVPYLVKAITLGEQVTLPIKHHHRAGITGLGDALCSGELTFHQGNFKFAGGCNQNFDTPYNKILVLKPEPQKAARLHVEVNVLNRRNKDEKKDFNFHVYQTGLRKVDPNDPNSTDVVYCASQNCSAALDALYQLLQQIKK